MLRILNIIMTLLFVLCVVVQINDPDPWRWMVIYAFAVVVTGMAAADRYTVLTVIGAAGFLLWSLYLFPSVLQIDNASSLVTDIKMDLPNVEEARESIGLLISATWFTVMAVVWFKRRNGATPGAEEESAEKEV